MIITVTLNPAIDKTADIEPLIPGGLNRVKSFKEDAGGKGVNVSRVVSMLGANSVATGFIGENNSLIFENALKGLNCKPDFIKIEGNTRVNLKLCDSVNGVTEINEPGLMVTEKQEEALIHDYLLSYARRDSVFVLAGSMHKNAKDNFYEYLTEQLKDKGAKVFLDADNESFRHALNAKPHFIKPNKDEILRYFKKQDATEAELIEMCKSLTKEGIKTVVLSLGKEGAIFISEDQGFKASAVDVKVESTVGAGDSMVAAFAFAAIKEMTFEQAAILAMACSAGAVTTKGTNPPSIELVNELKEQVVLEKLY